MTGINSVNNSPSRARSLSTTDAPSPESSTSSDSHSSSDPDVQLITLSPEWPQSPTFTDSETLHVDLDKSPDRRCFEFDPSMSFSSSLYTLQPFQSSSHYDMDDIIITPEASSATNSKLEMLKLEELLDDTSFEQPISVSPSLIYPSNPTDYISPYRQHEEKGSVHESNKSLTSIQDKPVSVLNGVEGSNSFGNSPDAPNEQNTAVSHQDSSPLSNFTPMAPQVPKSPSHLTVSPTSRASAAVLSSKIVYPPKDVCTDLPIFFPSIPPSGTKSRVETQIKLAFELAMPLALSSKYSSTYVAISSSEHLHQTASSSSNSLNGSPSPNYKALPLPADNDQLQHPPSHDRMGSYKYLQLPAGTVTKRRSANPATVKSEAKVHHPDPQEVLQMAAEVICSSPPHRSVQSCENCRAREAKRTARKVAARVRPAGTRPRLKSKGPGKKGSKSNDHLDPMEEDYEEPNADDSILQFNCGEMLNFSTGGVVLPMRITCYCRHHKEKIGFNIVFTLSDYTGRVVGRGTTPPILITDDHKSANAAIRLPPTSQQSLDTPSPPPLPSASLIPADDDIPATAIKNSQPVPSDLSPQRRNPETTQKKRRPKPYDGRPARPGAGSSSIDGVQGVVLALHPAHTRKQAEGGFLRGSLPGTRSPTPSEPTFIPISQSMNGTRYDGGSSPLPPGTPSLRSSPRILPTSAASTPVLSQGRSGSSGSPSLSSFSPEHQPYFDAKLVCSPFVFPIERPRIHRLIPSSGPTTGGIEITVLGSNFHASLPLECVFGGVVASSTHRWSDNTLVCLLPPRATPGAVSVEIRGVPSELQQDGALSLFHYVDESDRQLMELALQVVGLKMTGKIEEARNVAMRIVGNSGNPMGEGNSQMDSSSESFMSHSVLGSLTGVDLEALVIKLLTLLDIPLDDESKPLQSGHNSVDHKNATGQTLLHLAVFLKLPSLVSCVLGRGANVDARNNNGMTPLHFAALTGWKEGVEILLREGADPSIIDRMGSTPADRAKLGGFSDIVGVLGVCSLSGEDVESGMDGDDEAWQSEDESPEGGQPSVRLYHMRSRTASSVHLQAQVGGDSSDTDVFQTRRGGDGMMSEATIEKSSKSDTQPDRSFVKRLQRTLPQNILPNVQIPDFSHIQLPDMPWGGLSQIPVFPIFVPMMPSLPWLNVPRTDELSEKKHNLEGTPEDKHQHSLAMLWAAYDSIANNNTWKNQWEKWSAYIMAMQTANNGENAESDLPPYSPRRPDDKEEDVKKEEQDDNSTGLTPSSPAHVEQADSTTIPPQDPIPAPEVKPAGPASSLSSIAKGARRLGYRSWKVPESEVAAYHYKPKRQSNKRPDACVILDSYLTSWNSLRPLYHLTSGHKDLISRNKIAVA